jgi:hypothetical protein
MPSWSFCISPSQGIFQLQPIQTSGTNATLH